MEKISLASIQSERNFNKFVKENEKMLYSFAYSIVLNREDAMDAVQEALMRFYKSINRLDENKNIKAYLFQIVKNVCFDIVKSKRYSEDIENIPIHIKDNRDTQIDRKKIIKEALKTLNKQERMVVTLLIYQGFNSKEIGEIMEISPSTVRNHYMNGRNKIKNFIIKNYPEYARSV